MHALKPIKIGPVEVASPVILAPMTGVTDLPFRRVVKRYSREAEYRFERDLAAVKARLASTEAALAGAFVDGVSVDPEGRVSEEPPDGGLRVQI